MQYIRICFTRDTAKEKKWKQENLQSTGYNEKFRSAHCQIELSTLARTIWFYLSMESYSGSSFSGSPHHRHTKHIKQQPAPVTVILPSF